MAGCLPWAGSPKWPLPVVPAPVALAQPESAYSPHPTPACGWGSHVLGNQAWTYHHNRLQSRSPVLLTSPMQRGAGCPECSHRLTALSAVRGPRVRAAVSWLHTRRAGVMGSDMAPLPVVWPPTSWHLRWMFCYGGPASSYLCPRLPWDIYWLSLCWNYISFVLMVLGREKSCASPFCSCPLGPSPTPSGTRLLELMALLILGNIEPLQATLTKNNLSLADAQ